MEILKSIIGFFCSFEWVALIAILGIYFGLRRLQKDVKSIQKLKWINDLREEISNYISKLSEFFTLYTNQHDHLIKIKARLPTEERKDFFPTDSPIWVKNSYEPYRQCTTAFEKYHYKILLYLSTEKHKVLIQLIGEIKNLYDKTERRDEFGKFLSPTDFEAQAKLLLKKFEEESKNVIENEEKAVAKILKLP